MFKKKILIIDDSDLMLKLISDILKEADYDVVSAGDGEMGILKVMEEKPDLVILDVVMPKMDGFQVVKALRDDESNNLMPIIMLTAQQNEDDKLTGLELGADDYITKPFNKRELLSRVKNTLRRIDINRFANPLTGLHGNIEIQSEINHRIAKKSFFSVIYADLDNFKAFNDVYGYASGDTAIKLTADIIADNLSAFGRRDDFVGHVGGDDFVIITVPERSEGIASGIIKDFDVKIRSLYSTSDKERGYITTVDRRGKVINFPIMSISLAIISNEHREFVSHVQIAEIAAEVKKKAKEVDGSNYVKDRRKDNLL